MAEGRPAVIARIIDRINGPQLTSWPVFWVVLVVNVGIHFTGSPDLAGGSVAARMAAAVISNVALFGVLLITAPLRRLRGWTGRLAAVAAIIAGGAVRGVVLQWSLYVLGAASDLSVAYRLPAGIVTMTAAVSAASYVVGSLRDRAEKIRGAEALQERLVAALAELTKGLEIDRVAATEGVIADLRRQCAEAWESRGRASQQLQELADEVVRPLSHSLARHVPQIPSFSPATTVARLSVKETLTDIRAEDGLRPLLMASVSVILVIPALLTFYGPTATPIFALVIGVTLILSLTVGRLLSRIVTRGRSGLAQIAVLLVALLATALVIGIVLSLLEVVFGRTSAITGTAFVVIPIGGLMLALIASARAGQAAAADRIKGTTEELTWTLARTFAIRWQQRGDLARALHGPVQSAIYAAIEQLGRGGGPGAFDQAKAGLEASLVQALNPGSPAGDVEEALNEAAAVWRGIARVWVSITHGAGQALDGDEVCRGLVVDTSIEAISNAIRHGGARTVRVTVTQRDERLLQVDFEDDGGGFDGSEATGLGMELLRSCSVDVSHGAEGGWNRIRALLPIGTGTT